MSVRILNDEINYIFIIDVFDDEYRRQDRTTENLRDIYSRYGCVVFVDYYKETKNIFDMLANVKENCGGENVVLHICGHSAKISELIVGISIQNKIIVPFKAIENILKEINIATNTFILNLMAICESTLMTQDRILDYPVFTSNNTQGVGVTDKIRMMYERTSGNNAFLSAFRQVDLNNEFSFQNNI